MRIVPRICILASVIPFPNITNVNDSRGCQILGEKIRCSLYRNWKHATGTFAVSCYTVTLESDGLGIWWLPISVNALARTLQQNIEKYCTQFAKSDIDIMILGASLGIPIS